MPEQRDVTARGLRYEISILVGPCSQEEAEEMMVAAHEAVKDTPNAGPGTILKFWDENHNRSGSFVDGVEVL